MQLLQTVEGTLQACVYDTEGVEASAPLLPTGWAVPSHDLIQKSLRLVTFVE